MCMTPEAIDAKIYEGVLYLFEQEDDMRVDSDAPFMRIREWRREPGVATNGTRTQCAARERGPQQHRLTLYE